MLVISQPMHGGGWSTCPSKYLTKYGSSSIVNATHLNIKHIIANNTNHAIDLNITFHMIAHHVNFAIDDIIL